ncbi:hypothetical protein C1H46_000849 [Malus baccata]|uniref:Uncharacterized protein n=1 Tax=Malus baccata TaxID=106549 RepID=A0A540NR45_MALBA|nr:hypothetical protein C1H46_000849 [Malus baccata]
MHNKTENILADKSRKKIWKKGRNHQTPKLYPQKQKSCTVRIMVGSKDPITWSLSSNSYHFFKTMPLNFKSGSRECTKHANLKNKNKIIK